MFHPLFCFKVALLGITRNNINVAEDVGHAQVCVAVETSSMECPLDYPFDVQVRTIDYSAVSPDNFTAQKMTLTFPPCTPSLCVNITINDDSTLEKEEVFNVLLDLDGGASEHNITLVKNKTMVVIMDNDVDVVLELESVFVEVFEDEDASLCA
ncbi:hypothetical protein GBAR_LOCUS15904, partial [Geodia barretti]